jgi:hypothetical protein
MGKKIAPSEQKAQARRAVRQGQAEGQSGEELLSLLVRLSTERILQGALEQEQALALGRGRYEARGEKVGYRNGYENGTLRTGEGSLRAKVPQIRGQTAPYRSRLWHNVSHTSDVLEKLLVEMYGSCFPFVDIRADRSDSAGRRNRRWQKQPLDVRIAKVTRS